MSLLTAEKKRKELGVYVWIFLKFARCIGKALSGACVAKLQREGRGRLSSLIDQVRLGRLSEILVVFSHLSFFFIVRQLVFLIVGRYHTGSIPPLDPTP
jgi:hypothetical protein